MPQQIELPDKTIGEFPDDWSDAKIHARIEVDFPGAYKTAQPKQEQGSLLGAAQHVGTGALKTIVDIPATAVKAVAAPVALIEKGVGKLMGKTPTVDPTTQWMLDRANAAQDWAESKLDQLNTQGDIRIPIPLTGMSVPLGGTIGGALPFAAFGAGAALKAEAATSFLRRIGTSMMDAGIFSSVYETPRIMDSKTWKEAADKAKSAAVTIPMSAIMAGGLTAGGHSLGWAREKLGKTPEAKAEVLLEKGVPATEDLGANQPRVTPFDEVHAKEVEAETVSKAARLKENIEKTVYDKAEDAFTDATKRIEDAKQKVHKELTALEVKEATDPLLKQDKITLAQKTLAFLDKTKEFAADVQRTVDPISRMDGWKEREPFVNFEGKLNYHQQVIAPELRKAIVETLPDLPSRQVVTLLRDASGREVVAKLPRSERMDAVLDSTGILYDQLYQYGVEGDILKPETHRANFINRIYSRDTAPKVEAYLSKNRPLDAKNPHSFKRSFDDIYTAAEAGFKPATLDVADLTDAYGLSLMQSLAKGQLVKDITTVMPDRVKWATRAPEGMFPLSDRIKSAHRTRTEMKDEVEVKVPEMLYADKDVHQLLSAVMDPSVTKMNLPMKTLEYVNTRQKLIMLSLDLYHWVNVKRQAAALGAFSPQKGLAMLDVANPNHPLVKMLIQNGLDLGESPDWGRQAYLKFVSETGIKKALGVAWDNSPFKLFSRHLWGTTHRGLKTLAAVTELQRYLKDPKMTERYSPEELANHAAKFANNLMGGMSWSMRGRTKTFNSLARLVMLAPDWFETRMNLAYSAFKPTPEGASARRYWLTFIAQMSATAMVGNAIMQKVDPRLKNHPETQGAKGLINIVVPVYDKRGHPLVLGMGGSFQYVFDFLTKTGDVLSNRQAVLLRAGMEFATQRDWTGKKIAPTLTAKENWINLGKNLIPIPLFLQLADIEFNGAGITNLKDKMDVTRSLARSFGMHPSSGYPAELRKQFNFLSDRKDTVMQKIRKLNDAGRQDMARQEAQDYNKDVMKLVNESKETYRGSEILHEIVKKRLLIQ